MHPRFRQLCIAVAASALTSLACSVHAQNLELLIQHQSTSMGADGVERSSAFSERMTRSNDQIWIHRVIPANAPDEHAHAGEKEHKHLEWQTAVRWISKEPNGAVKLRLVPRDEKFIVNVSKTDFENVGFAGSWSGSWNLMDPAVLKRMTLVSTKGDFKTYKTFDKGRQVDVVWNTKLDIPMSVESKDATSRNKTTVKLLAVSKAQPWDALKGYQSKDYTDYLD